MRTLSKYSLTHTVVIDSEVSGTLPWSNPDRSEFSAGFQAFRLQRYVLLRWLRTWTLQYMIQESDKAKEKGLVALNEKGIFGEVERLGTGLIKRITVQSKSWYKFDIWGFVGIGCFWRYQILKRRFLSLGLPILYISMVWIFRENKILKLLWAKDRSSLQWQRSLGRG